MRAARIDGNHHQIVQMFEAAGWKAYSLAKLGRGAPDLLVGRPGLAYVLLVEVKNRTTSYGRKGLNPLQMHFASDFPVYVVSTPGEARALIREAEGAQGLTHSATRWGRLEENATPS